MMSSFGPPRNTQASKNKTPTAASSKASPSSSSRGGQVGGRRGGSTASAARGGGASSISSKNPRPINKPSDRLNPKTIDPFTDQKKAKSAFETVYVSGGVPCRLVHGSVKHKLQWESNPEDIAYDPVLITLAEGLKEFKHPYQFVAQRGFKELLQVSDADIKAVPLLSRLIPPLRAALSSTHESVYVGAVVALVDLSIAVGPHLNPHLKSVLSYLSKHQNDKRYREKIMSSLQEIEQACGRESVAIIKSKIPTYSSIT